MYHVLYEDGDSEDMNDKELLEGHDMYNRQTETTSYLVAVLPGQYRSTKSSTFFLLFSTTGWNSIFVYKGEVVHLWACRGFPEVLVVQRTGLRLNWEGLNG